ncbi:branched-chain amino acid transport system ATP-binding protein [Paraburkholderia sp. GAS199]|uniref:ABC transporter ATP-binding protein n=1 Tax=Paraburkholderia sp. GAS199 TaxID=3035126 RepID=UPI003D1F1A98
MSLLRVAGLSKSFGGVKAVDDVSFDLEAGQLLALLGPNGAGKSTCFNMVNGQLAPSAGSIQLDGQELVGMRPRAIWRLGVGRTFQIAATFNSMTVLENVQMALVSRERKTFALWRSAGSRYADEALALLEQVGMAAHAQRACGVLAYGDVKRVELAIALANRPKLLLMDEPTAGMAPQERHALMALTRRLVNEHRIGVLFTEHSMDVVFAYADRMLVLARGKLIAEGDAETIRNDARVQEVYFGTGKTFRPQASWASAASLAPHDAARESAERGASQ